MNLRQQTKENIDKIIAYHKHNITTAYARGELEVEIQQQDKIATDQIMQLLDNYVEGILPSTMPPSATGNDNAISYIDGYNTAVKAMRKKHRGTE